MHVWDARQALFVDLNPLLVREPGRGIETIATIVQHDRALCAQQFECPARLEVIVLVRAPTCQETTVVECGGEAVWNLKSQHLDHPTLAGRRAWCAHAGKPMNDIHQVAAVVRHVAAGECLEVAPFTEHHRFQRLSRTAEEELLVEFSFEFGIVKWLRDCTVSLRPSHRDFADRAVRYSPLHVDDPGCAAPLHADLYDPVSRPHAADRLHAFGDRVRHWFLAVDVLASRDGIQHHSDTPMVGCCDQHRIDGVSFQVAAVVAIALRTLVSAREALFQVRPLDVANRRRGRSRLPESGEHTASTSIGSDQGYCSPVGGAYGGRGQQHRCGSGGQQGPSVGHGAVRRDGARGSSNSQSGITACVLRGEARLRVGD